MREQNFWSEILKMYYFTSLYLGPVWPNGYLFFNISNLAIWNMGCPKTQEFCHSRFKILPNTLNKTSTIGQRFIKFCQSGEISPNLVTLQPRTKRGKQTTETRLTKILSSNPSSFSLLCGSNWNKVCGKRFSRKNKIIRNIKIAISLPWAILFGVLTYRSRSYKQNLKIKLR